MFSSFVNICLTTLYLIYITQSVVNTSPALQIMESSVKQKVTTWQQNIPFPTHSLKNKNGDGTSTVTQHKDLITRQFDAAEYQPRMEVVAVGLDYDNETAIMRVSVFVDIPIINGSQYTSNLTVKPALTENFTNYEIYLTALKEDPVDQVTNPPSSCLIDSFLQHSRREVFVDECSASSLSNGTNNTSTLEFPTTTVNPATSAWETSCVDEHANNFTVVFRHVYSGYYCLLIQPQAGAHTRRTFTRMIRYETSIVPADITQWQTTIDLQPMPSRQCISAAFTVPDPSYQIISNQLRVDLVQVSGIFCNDSSQMKLIQSKIVAMEPGKQAADVEFLGKPPGVYCVLVVPIDERCDGNNFWKAKGRSCARHSAKAVLLQAPPSHVESNGTNKQVTIFKPLAMDAWLAVIIVGATASGLVLASLLGIVIMYYRRQKEQVKRRQHQLLLEWKPIARASDDELVTAEDSKHLPISLEKDAAILDMDLEGNNDALVTSGPISILLLYRRDDLQITRRVIELRNRLQAECGNKIKVYDYGDESQWEDIALEGLNWLPNRIYRNPSNNKDSIKRVIVIHSPLPLIDSQVIGNEDEEDKEDTKDSLLNSQVGGVEKWLQGTCDHRVTTDPEFLYGMQLLLGCIHESVDDCAGHQSIYSRVFNARFTDITESSEKENKSAVYPNLQLAPFTCYLLPDHFNQLVQHITATQ